MKKGRREKSGRKSKGAGSSKDFSTMSVDDFMNGIGDSSDDESTPEDSLQHGDIVNRSQHSSEGDHGQVPNDDSDDEDEGDGERNGQVQETASDDDDDENEEKLDPKSESTKIKESLKKYKDTDPEFYKYLEEHDQSLLKFDLSDLSDSEDEENPVHIPATQLEENSDESDYEEGSHAPTRAFGQKLTFAMVRELGERLREDKTASTINEVTQAFHAALQRVSPEIEQEPCRYKVDGSGVFNDVVQLCVLDLLPAIKRFLKLPPGQSNIEPSKVKKWVKMRGPVKNYLTDLLKLLEGLTSTDTTSLLVKHIHQMCPFIVLYRTLRKHYLKKLISLWGEGEYTIQVLAFLCALRMTTLCQKVLLEQVLKIMYTTYIKNSRFVSANTLPGINFMRRSLSEMFLLDENVSYSLAFLYIRQLGIHLRNAIVIHKKETIQTVYNWQFLSSMALWTEVLSAQNKPTLESLRFPLVQLIIGTVKLYGTPEYFPLRFHYIKMLSQISRCTRTFVPALPLILEVLDTYNFGKKQVKVSKKPLEFNCILRVSRPQLAGKDFNDALIDSIYGALLEYLSTESNSICFADIALPVSICLKKFLKRYKIANFCRKMRQVLDKIEENVRFIENERKSITFELSDQSAVVAWEKAVEVKGTPISTFYNSWAKVNAFKQPKTKTEKDNIGDNISLMMKKKKSQKAKSNNEGPVDLLPSDDSDDDTFFGPGADEDDDEDEEKEEKPAKTKKRRAPVEKSRVKQKKKLKLSKQQVEDDDDTLVPDIVEDSALSEW